MTRVYSEIGRNLDSGGRAISLAMSAYNRAVGHGPWTQEVDAEAECLLREGWRP